MKTHELTHRLRKLWWWVRQRLCRHRRYSITRHTPEVASAACQDCGYLLAWTGPAGKWIVLAPRATDVVAWDLQQWLRKEAR